MSGGIYAYIYMFATRVSQNQALLADVEDNLQIFIYKSERNILIVSMLQVQFRLIREAGGVRKLVALRDLNPGELIFSEAKLRYQYKF